MAEPTVTTGEGRIIHGRPCVHAQKTHLGQVQMDPATGLPKMESYIGVMFPKTDTTLYDCINAINAWKVAYPAITNLKFIDTDDPTVKPNENYLPGHWVFHFGSIFPITYWRNDNTVIPAVEPDFKGATEMHRGDYVRVKFTPALNLKNPAKPVVYVNPVMICHTRRGEQIIGGEDAATAFGVTGANAGVAVAGAPAPVAGAAPPAAIPVMPAAAPAVPGAVPGVPAVATAAPAVPALPAVPAVPVAGAPAVPGAVQTPPPALPGPPAPAAGFAAGVVPTVAPAVPGVPGVPPAVPAIPVAPVEPVMTALAVQQGQTYAGLIGGGWTEDMMRANGYIV